MPHRTIEDRLREEYFDYLPEVRRVVSQLEAEVRYHSLPVLLTLEAYEQLVFKSRIKECESAVKALRWRQEFETFDLETPERYSILDLHDLAGVGVLVFPQRKLVDVNDRLSRRFEGWEFDPVRGGDANILARKYFGKLINSSQNVVSEYQIVPMLIGLFWEVEDSAMYKPAPALKGIERSAPMKHLRSQVEFALSRFEAEFESFLLESSP